MPSQKQIAILGKLCQVSEKLIPKIEEIMTQEKGDDPKSMASRKTYPVYDANPSLRSDFPMRIASDKPQMMGTAYMIAPGGEESLPIQGAFQFVERKLVDTSEFVKVYAGCVKQWSKLSKTGVMMFEMLYREMAGKKGKDRDTVLLNYASAQKLKSDLSRSTFYRGLNELLEKGFIFRTIGADLFFVNITFMYNGDRIRIVQEFQRGQKQMSLMDK